MKNQNNSSNLKILTIMKIQKCKIKLQFAAFAGKTLKIFIRAIIVNMKPAMNAGLNG